MKGIFCYYSGSGNTKLACQYVAKNNPQVVWTFCDIQREEMPDFSAYAVAGFATFTDFWGVSQRMIQFMQAIPEQKDRLAFTLISYGMFLGFALRDLGRLARSRGFKTIAGFALHTPENYPPMICGGMAMEDSPNPKELGRFKMFVTTLADLFNQHAAGKTLQLRKPGESFWLSLFSAPKRTTARKQMGLKQIDQTLCTKCRTCEKGCPYQAIQLNPYPEFDQNVCYGCWTCFHHCPKKAIYTEKFRNRGYYSKPIQKLVEKLG